MPTSVLVACYSAFGHVFKMAQSPTAPAAAPTPTCGCAVPPTIRVGDPLVLPVGVKVAARRSRRFAPPSNPAARGWRLRART